MQDAISEKSVERLCAYRRLLIRFRLRGKDRFYSHELADEANLTPAQVRRDLMSLDVVGTPSYGYITTAVIEELGRLIEGDSGQQVALVGAGRLGEAILHYFVDRRPDLRIVAAFDRDPAKAGGSIATVPCLPVSELERVVRDHGVLVGMLTVPGGAAQETADRLIAAGVRAIISFAPVKLKVPEGIHLEEMDISIAMEKAAYFGRMLARRERERGAGAPRPAGNGTARRAKGERTMKRILCIDDDRDLTENYRAILAAEGYEVAIAHDGESGYEQARASRPDLIILDVMMQSATEGFHVAYRFRGDADLKYVPILMLTGISGEVGLKFDRDRDGEFLPVDAFVDKPVAPSALLAAAKRLLQLPRERINVEGAKK